MINGDRKQTGGCSFGCKRKGVGHGEIAKGHNKTESDECVHYLDCGDSFRGAHMSQLIKLSSLGTVYCMSYIFIKLLQKGL